MTGSVARRRVRRGITLSVIGVSLIVVLVWWSQDDASQDDAAYDFLGDEEFFVEISSHTRAGVEIFRVSRTGVESAGRYGSPPVSRFRAGHKQTSTEQYAIRPDRGRGRHAEVSVRNRSTGRDVAPSLQQAPKYYCLPGAFSPDGATLALCAKRSSGAFSTETVVLLDVTSMSVMRKLSDPHELVEDLMWSQNGQALVVLVSEFSHGKGPLESLSAMSGHPVEYRRYFVRLIRMEGFEQYRLPITDERVRLGAGSLRAQSL